MEKIRIDGKEYQCPTSWDDIDMLTYCKVFRNLPTFADERDEVTTEIDGIRLEAVIMSRLLGMEDDFVSKLPIAVYSALRAPISFVYEIKPFIESGIMRINIDGRSYYIPEPSEMALRQYIDADIIMKEEGSENQFIELLACLLLPVDGKEYDGKYQDIIPKIERMKCSDALPFIYSFYKKKEVLQRLSEDFSRVEEAADQLLHSIQSSSGTTSGSTLLQSSAMTTT